jgi:hypothetical protein
VAKPRDSPHRAFLARVLVARARFGGSRAFWWLARVLVARAGGSRVKKFASRPSLGACELLRVLVLGWRWP